jgi:hypothetical protein
LFTVSCLFLSAMFLSAASAKYVDARESFTHMDFDTSTNVQCTILSLFTF